MVSRLDSSYESRLLVFLGHAPRERCSTLQMFLACYSRTVMDWVCVYFEERLTLFKLTCTWRRVLHRLDVL